MTVAPTPQTPAPTPRTSAAEGGGVAGLLARRLSGVGSARFADLMQQAAKDLGNPGPGEGRLRQAAAEDDSASSQRADSERDARRAEDQREAPPQDAATPAASPSAQDAQPAPPASRTSAAATGEAPDAEASTGSRLAAAREPARKAAGVAAHGLDRGFGTVLAEAGSAPEAGRAQAAGAGRKAAAREAGEGTGAVAAAVPASPAIAGATDPAAGLAALAATALQAPAAREAAGVGIVTTVADMASQALAAGAPTERATAAPAEAPALPPSAYLEPTLDSADFAPALGAQLSAWARDGVQQARLELNPRELGPVSVQIQLEGLQARVDFGADSATTRAALEQAFPQLSAALQAEGLTLSGGGVSQHGRGGSQRESPGSHGGGRSGQGRHDAAGSQELPVGPARVAAAARRLLDLYA